MAIDFKINYSGTYRCNYSLISINLKISILYKITPKQRDRIKCI